MRPTVTTTAFRRGVHVQVTVIAEPDAAPRDIYGAISEAAEKARDRFRPPVPASPVVLPRPFP